MGTNCDIDFFKRRNYDIKKTILELLQMKKIILAVTGLMFVLGLTACGTVEGLGKDIKTLGDKLEKSSK